MKEKMAPIKLDGSDACGFEGVEKRPIDCSNNPWRHPENYRPNVCLQCPGDSEIWKVAQMPLPLTHIIFKQTQQKRASNS